MYQKFLAILQVPVGVLLCFFGFWALDLAIASVLCFLIANAAAPLGTPLAALCGLAAGFFSIHAGGRSVASRGAVCGSAIGLSFFGVHESQLPFAVVMAVVGIVSLLFSILYLLCEEEIVVYVSAYTGSYLMWQGLSSVDSDVWILSKGGSWLQTPDYATLWYNLVNLLLIGLIGSCVQILLIHTQAFAHGGSEQDYIEIL